MAKNKPRRIVVFVLFRFFLSFLYILPISIGIKVGQGCGILAFLFFKRERDIALDNLNIAFGNSKTLKEKRLIVKRLFENLGRSFVEVVCIDKIKRDIDTYIECKGIEVIESLVREKRGGIVLTAHFGNWELLAHYFAIKGFKVNVIARRMRMEGIERFLDRIRRKNKVNVLYRDASAKDVIELLKRNEFIGMMPDQDMDSVSGVFVDFFGKKAWTADGLAVLNFLTHAPIIPCFIVRKDSGGHMILIEEPIELSRTGDRDKDVLQNTERYTKVIETYIRRFPSQWVWFHERWKTSPE